MGNRDDNHTNDIPLQDNASGTEISNLRRRAFIKRLAKAGTIAPAAILLHDASANAVNAYAVGS